MNSSWNERQKLRGRLQSEFARHSVLVRDGSPHITGPSPELVSVRITGVKEDVISGPFLIVAAIFCSPSLRSDHARMS